MSSRNKALISICLACIAVYACILRCLHLLDKRYYYVISPDSYLFHSQASRLLAGESIVWGGWHSGITYPIAYAAKAISLLSGASVDQSLRWASTLVPPLLAVISVLLLYWFVSRMFDRRVALFSAFSWAVAPVSILMQGAGYLDRDGLSLVLVMAGAFLFHQSLSWNVRLFGRSIGWLLACAAVGGIEVLLYVEWLWLGPALLLGVLCLTWVAEVLFDVARRVVPSFWESDLDVVTIPGRVVATLPGAFKVSNWRSLSVLLVLNCGATASLRTLPTLDSLWKLLRPVTSGSAGVAELQGLSGPSLLSLNVLLITLIVGMAVGLKRMSRADSFAIGWFAGLLFAGLFIGRLFVYAAPALCVLSGVGLAYLFDVGGLNLLSLKVSLALGGQSRLRLARAVVGLILILGVVFFSLTNGYLAGSSPFAAADQDWQEALRYLRDNSDPDAVIMSHWDFGYFIRDLADRKPLVDNGDWDEDRNKDVALAYTATDASEVAAVMHKRGVDYLIFSTDYGLLPTITYDAFGESYGDGQSIPKEMRDSIYAQSLSGTFISGGGISRVYPEISVKKPRVVILMLD